MPLPIACDGEGDPAKRRSGEARLLAIKLISNTMASTNSLTPTFKLGTNIVLLSGFSHDVFKHSVRIRKSQIEKARR